MNENLYEKETLKGNLLKYVFTRIDYDDIVEVDSYVIKNIRERFKDIKILTRMLRADDFSFKDPTGVVDLPEEIIEKTRCTVLFFYELDMIIEINQYFTRLIYKVDKDKYDTYEKTILNRFITVIEVLNSKENLSIKRVAINKINEALFNSITQMKKIFKSSIVRTNIFTSSIKWNLPSSELKTTANFTREDVMVNFTSIIESIKNKKRYMRLILDYEVYVKDNIKNTEDIKNILIKLNSHCYELFVDSLTTKGFEMLKNNERVSEDYE